MADNPPVANWDKPRQSNGYGDSRDMSWRRNSYGSNNGWFDAFGRRGFMDAREPHQQNGYRVQNNQSTTWQRGPIAPSMSWRDQGRPAEMGSHNGSHTAEYVHPDAAGRRLYSTDTRPNSEMGRAWRPSIDRGGAPARALAAYSDVGVDNEGNLATSIVGTCQDMCPVREREQRQRLRDLAIFERINGNIDRTSATLAVKKFCRTMTVAELRPSDIRPQHVLWGTLQYLLRMLDRSDFTFESVHAFLFDRTRAVRQELGMQCIANSQAITMFEEIVRFHIMSERELRQQKAGNINDENSELNFQQLSKSLLTLLNLYSAVDAEGSPGWQHEAEFHGYYVLLNLGDRDQFKAEPLSLWFRRVRPSVLQAPDFMYARRVLRCYRSDNYKGFFDLAQKASYLQGCLMELYFGEMRSVALKAINFGGYRVHPHPVADIAKNILMKEGDTEELCKAHGLTTSIDKDHNMSLIAKQASFNPSTQTFRHQCSLISRKRAPTLFQEIAGERTDIY